MIVVGVVIALAVAAAVGSWLVDRRRRRRNESLDAKGLLGAKEVRQVTDTSPSAESEARIAEATLWEARHTGLR